MAIEEFLLRRFEQPDEVREFPLGRFELVEIGGMTIGRATYEPGWKWSEHVGSGPDERCKVEHLGLVVSGRAAVAGPDYEGVMAPGDIFAVPPDHDSWVVGDEPYVSLHFLGAGLRRRVAGMSGRSGQAGRVPGKFKTEAVVLRTIRYGEADRILHLYSATRGRIGAIAKGVRKPRSRFGGRLEPFFRLDLVLHEGRGELLTVTAAHTLAAHPNLRADGAALGAAARACDAVLRLCDSEEPNPAAYNLLCRYLAILDGSESLDGDGSADGAAGLSTALAFRLKLALATGFAPELASCARCGEADELAGFSGGAGGVVCGACERDGFPLSGEAHGFMVEALGRPLAQAPEAGDRALRQAERAISETLEHHAHVQLRAAA